MPLSQRPSPKQRRQPRWWLAVAGALLLSACQPVFENRGNLPDPEAVSKIVPGKSTKAEVTQLLGSPSTISTFDPDTWYYINRQSDRIAFYDPELISQRIYVVQFDEKGTVKDLQRRDNDAHDVAMLGRTTPAPGRELTFLEQLVGNFGVKNKSKKQSKDDE